MSKLKNRLLKISRLYKIIPLQIYRNVVNQHHISVMYHVVTDKQPKHLKHLYPIISTKHFEKDLDFLLKYFSPISVNDLHDSIVNNIPLPQNSVLLTFDDGLSEFYSVIAPILEKRSIPAVCFINTAFIDNKDMFYRLKASLLIELLQNTKEFNLKTKEWFKNQKLNINNYKTELLKINYNNQHLLNELADILDFSFDQYLVDKKPYLSTNEINDLIKRGFDIGAHSVDHPYFSNLSYNEQEEQITKSIKFIQKHFAYTDRWFAFPFTDDKVDCKLYNSMFESKKMIDLSFGTAGLKKDIFNQNIQRIPMEYSRYSGSDIIYTEYFYYLIKGLFFRNTNYHK